MRLKRERFEALRGKEAGPKPAAVEPAPVAAPANNSGVEARIDRLETKIMAMLHSFDVPVAPVVNMPPAVDEAALHARLFQLEVDLRRLVERERPVAASWHFDIIRDSLGKIVSMDAVQKAEQDGPSLA